MGYIIVAPDGTATTELPSNLLDVLKGYHITPDLISIIDFYDGAGDYREAFLDVIAYCQTNNKTIYFPPGTYYISGTFTISTDINIQADNAIIQSDITTGAFITFSGSIREYASISESLVKGQNHIKTTLEPNVNDLIKIRSDQPFGSVVNYNEDVGRGEMAVVRNVYDGVVFLHNAIMDDYSNANWDDERESPALSTIADIRIAKVTPISVNITGKLTIENTTTDYSADGDSCDGIRFEYCRDININLTVVNFMQRLIKVRHCYSGVVNINGYGASRRSDQTGDGSPGYGVEIIGTTMNIAINGTLSGCRHCVVFNGEEGVPWSNPIKIIGYGARSAGIIDAHYPCGNLIVDGSILKGGSMVVIENSINPAYDVDTGAKSTPYGIVYGARDVIIRNTTITGCNTGILPRNNFDVENVEITNVYFQDCTYGATQRVKDSAESTIKNITFRNITISNGMLYRHNKDYFDGERIIMENITLINSRLFGEAIGTETKTNVVELICSNINGYGPYSMIAVGDGIHLISLNNSITKDFDNLIYGSNILTSIILNGIKTDADRLMYFIADITGTRIETLMINSVLYTGIGSYLVEFAEVLQEIETFFASNIMATGVSGETNGVVTNEMYNNNKLTP